MKKAIPNLYYYDSEDIDTISLSDIEGNAVVILSNHCAYFVKNNTLRLEDGVLKMYHIALDSRRMGILSRKEGKIILNDVEWKDLEEPIEYMLRVAKFPYVHATVVLDNNAEITIEFSKDEKLDRIHPLLHDCYRLQKDGSNLAHSPTYLLKCLRDLKGDLYCEQSISFFHKGGTKMGFGFTKGTQSDVGIDGMIDSVLQANMPLYKDVFKKIDYISSRFSEAILTSKKQEILKDFRLYCGMHADPEISNAELLKGWLTEYMKNNSSQNPIETLSTHRRTKFTMFNPKETDSIKLLRDFIGSKHNLEELIEDVLNKMSPQTASNMFN